MAPPSPQSSLAIPWPCPQKRRPRSKVSPLSHAGDALALSWSSGWRCGSAGSAGSGSGSWRCASAGHGTQRPPFVRVEGGWKPRQVPPVDAAPWRFPDAFSRPVTVEVAMGSSGVGRRQTSGVLPDSAFLWESTGRSRASRREPRSAVSGHQWGQRLRGGEPCRKPVLAPLQDLAAAAMGPAVTSPRASPSGLRIDSTLSPPAGECRSIASVQEIAVPHDDKEETLTAKGGLHPLVSRVPPRLALSASQKKIQGFLFEEAVAHGPQRFAAIPTSMLTPSLALSAHRFSQVCPQLVMAEQVLNVRSPSPEGFADVDTMSTSSASESSEDSGDGDCDLARTMEKHIAVDGKNLGFGCPDRERGLRSVVDKTRLLFNNKGRKTCSKKRTQREVVYADLLLKEPEVHWQAGRAGYMRASELQRIAGIFAEFDGGLRGFIRPHALRTLLRRTGRPVDATMLCDMLEELEERRGLTFEKSGFDFVEVVDVMAQCVEVETLQLRNTLRSIRCAPVSLSGLASELRKAGVFAREEHLRQTAFELGLLDSEDCLSSHARLLDEHELEQKLHELADRCRDYERLRASERAGFTHDEMAQCRHAWENVACNEHGEVARSDLIKSLHRFAVLGAVFLDTAAFEKVVRRVDRSGHGTFSFEETLQLLRRFLDEQEVEEVLQERLAARMAGLKKEDVAGLRQVYDMVRGEAQAPFEFSQLQRAVALFGGTLTSAQSAELQRIFSFHVLPADEPAAIEHLHFPEFLTIIGHLWDQDFAGILTTCEQWLQEVENS